MTLSIFIYLKDRLMGLDDADDVFAMLSATNQKKEEYDWENIILYSHSIAL